MPPVSANAVKALLRADVREAIDAEICNGCRDIHDAGGGRSGKHVDEVKSP